MQIKKIQIKNFRMLENIEIEQERDLSLFIGKNNSGKTSVLHVFKSFLKGGGFCFDDFNTATHEKFKRLLDIGDEEATGLLDSVKIILKIYIEYDEEDSLENVSPDFHQSLDPQDNVVVLAFEYGLREDKLSDLKDAFSKFVSRQDNNQKTIIDYLKKNIDTYCRIKILSLQSGNEDKFSEIKDKDVSNVIKFEAIGAKRKVSEDRNSYDLSTIVSSYYENNAKQDAFADKKEELEASLSKIDDTLSDNYHSTFEGLLETLKQFGINNESGSSDIQIISDISSRNIITKNSAVVYEQGDYRLPESYNGLGYINLIYMILEIHNKLDSFKATEDKKSACVNLLFLEEPEAHMHPQMQYIFIHHIKEMLRTKSHDLGVNLQTIISTHSPHIASQSEFCDIKYFDIVGKNCVKVKSIRDFMEEEKPENVKFLKRYLTVHNSELFFADKAILIEGPTERLLLPYMMREIDRMKLEIKDDKTGDIKEYDKPIERRLLSQNISVIEVGGWHAHRFRRLLEFLHIKTLIITDLDSVGTDNTRCEVEKGIKTSNKAITDFLGDKSLAELLNLPTENKLVNDLFRIEYQVPEEDGGYHARSFEDSWIEINRTFLNSDNTYVEAFPKTVESAKSSYDLAQKISNKIGFALDIIFSTSNTNR